MCEPIITAARDVFEVQASKQMLLPFYMCLSGSRGLISGNDHHYADNCTFSLRGPPMIKELVASARRVSASASARLQSEKRPQFVTSQRTFCIKSEEKTKK